MRSATRKSSSPLLIESIDRGRKNSLRVVLRCMSGMMEDGEGREGKRGWAVEGEQEEPRALSWNRSCERKERRCVCVTFAASKRPCNTLVFISPCIVNLFVRSMYRLSLSLSIMFPSFSSFSRRIHWKVTDKKFRIIKMCKNIRIIFIYLTIIVTFRIKIKVKLWLLNFAHH